MITDIHVHDFPGVSLEAIVAEAKRVGIDRLVWLGDVFRFGLRPDAEQIRTINESTRRIVAADPAFHSGFCHLNPLNGREANETEMALCLDRHDFRGVKLEISVNCRDISLDPIMEGLEARGKALLHHAWFKTVGQYPDESTPADIAALAKRFPRVTIVMAHLAGCGIRGVELVADCANIVIDTSGGQPEAGFIEYAVKRIGADRLVYGSDATGRDFGCQLAKVLAARISDADREKVLCRNAERILGQ